MHIRITNIYINFCVILGTDNNVGCLTCSSLGDLSKLIMCCSCGDHFHSTCIGLANLPGNSIDVI